MKGFLKFCYVSLIVAVGGLMFFSFGERAEAQVYPHIDNIEPIGISTQTAFTLKIDGINFNSNLTQNRVQFQNVPWTKTKDRAADRGNATHLEFDIPSNYFSPADAGEWRVYVINAGFGSDNYKTFIVGQTCEQLGGVCCSTNNKVCAASAKKSGASDCSECCSSIGQCKESAIPFPQINSISPTGKAAETAFELTISGTNFNPTLSQNRVQFEKPGITTKERSPKSGSVNELKFDIPANFFTPQDAGDWEVRVSSYYQNAWLLSNDFKTFTVNPSITKTCRQIGGEGCCPAGKICEVGKKVGASDCSECCTYLANCVTPVCSWRDNTCGQSPCTPTQKHQTCGPAGCSGGTCTADQTRCVEDIACGATPPPSSTPVGKLEVSWPNSPMGTSLNDDSKLVDLIKYLYEWGISLGGFAAFIALIIAGFQYLTSAGNAGKMKDAMDRIKSAGLGLVLLFGSFLILNTINPQLTELKMPTIPSGSSGATAVEAEKVDLPTKECESVTLFSGTNYDNPFTTLYGPKDQEKTLSQEVGSVKMKGSCQLTLYRFSSFGENADKPSMVLFGNTPNVELVSGGITNFGSVKLTDSSFKIPTIAP